MLDGILSVDKSLFLLLNTVFACPVLDAFFRVITETANWVAPLVIVALIVLVGVRREGGGRLRLVMRPGWKRVLSAIALAAVVVSVADPVAARVLKPLFHRPRPCNPDALVEGGRYLLGLKRSLGFPSNHAANMIGVATLLTCFFPRRWLWFFVPATLVAFSRIYLGVHYPLDVLGGAAFGALVGVGAYGVYGAAVRAVSRKDECRCQMANGKCQT
jgi:undecaprenyl-diphosphatase